MALTKKSLNNFLPNGFETQNKEGYKANFTNDRILSGYEKDTLEILSGPNLNNFIDKTGKNFNTLNDLLEYFNEMPIDSFPIVNASNQLDYKSINSFFRNVGELVFSSVPIDDKNLHLADGSLLDGKGIYRVFVDFIGKMATKYPNLFTDEATWQATVSKYGTCGKYVWNAENKTLRLPRLKGIVEATIDQNSIGNITEAGLPNITGQIVDSNDLASYPHLFKGAFKFEGTTNAGREANDKDGATVSRTTFDASRSSKVYGKSNTVQPQTVKQYIYIVVSVDTEETTKLTSVFQYRGSVPTFEDLPKEGNITGDVWNVDDTDVNYVWDGNEWDQLSGSVDLTGYYTKEQADTRFATVTSLESNVENLQAKITQNTTDIGSLGLGGLVASSLEKGKALKYLETKGNITEDADVYNDVYNYKHSSFDLSKFEVVGSPTITSDGVASGFAKENSIQAILHNDVTINNKSFILKNKYKVGKDNSKPNMLYCTANTIRTELGANRKTLQSILPANLFNNNTTIYCAINFDNAVSVDDVFDFEMILNLENKTFTIKAKKDGKNYEASKTIDLRDDFIIKSLNIGSFYASTDFFWQGSIDLKQFSITVDGKEVFNGNKTGLDVIKPDNYTVVGSPTISDDGVASGFTLSNDYIVVNKQILNYKELVFETKFIYTKTDTVGSIYWANGIAFRNIIGVSGNVQFYIEKEGKYYSVGYPASDFKEGDIVLSRAIIDKSFISVEVFVNNVSLGVQTLSNPIDLTSISKIGIGANYVGNNPYNGSIDLNSFKIYVDGELVYQPCLKIPYNISKTGLKVANADARERVIGMGKDYGYSQYFTIDEENKNATLPIGAGITGRQDLIASFDDGTNKYEQFSDLTFKQSGKCTANTAVTFIQPYKDDTYKLSVPYSAKTKTGFTPTVSGDWFAEGKIYLD